MELLGAARLLLLGVHGASFALCTVGTALASPSTLHPAERRLRAGAAERWGALAGGVAAALQHLTVCSLGLLVLYLGARLRYTHHHRRLTLAAAGLVAGGREQSAALLAVLVMPLQTIVGVLYWGFVLYDPWTLFPRDTFPRDQKVADAAIRATHAQPS